MYFVSFFLVNIFNSPTALTVVQLLLVNSGAHACWMCFTPHLMNNFQSKNMSVSTTNLVIVMSALKFSSTPSHVRKLGTDLMTLTPPIWEITNLLTKIALAQAYS